jgi:branched-chain amino acid transport system substrate-binding protein
MRQLATTCLLASVALAVACGGDGDDATAPDTIPIGFVGQASNSQRIAFLTAALHDLNDKGGVDLPEGHRRLDLLFADHGGSAEGGVAAMHRLADQGVTTVVDPNLSAIILGDAADHSDGAAAVAKARGMVMISGGATSPEITDLDDDGYVWRTTPSDAVQGKVAADTLAEQGVQTAAILHRDDPYGRGLAQQFQASFESSGGAIVGVADYPIDNPEQLDYTAQLDEVFANKPAAVMLVSIDEVYTIAHQIVVNGYLDAYGADELIFFGTDGFFQPDVLLQNLPAEVLARLQGTAPSGDRSTADYHAMLTIAAEQGITDPDNVDSSRYDAILLLALAIQAAQSTEGAAIKAVLQDISRADPGDVEIHVGEWAKAKEALLAGNTIDFEGASGGIEFSDQGDPTVGWIVIWKVFDTGAGFAVDESTLVPFEL